MEVIVREILECRPSRARKDILKKSVCLYGLYSLVSHEKLTLPQSHPLWLSRSGSHSVLSAAFGSV